MTFIEDSVYIIKEDLKKSFLLELSKQKELLDIKIMSLRELLEALTFSYDEETVAYLMSTYNYKYDNAVEVLNNLKYIEFKDYKNKKLNSLVELKKELDPLLIKNDLLKKMLYNKKIIVYKYPYLDSFEKKLLDSLNVTYQSEELKKYEHVIYKFSNIFDEVLYVSNKIRELINQGISINKIKIVTLPKEYIFLVKLIFKMQKLNIVINDESIYSTKIVKDYLIDLDILRIKNKYDMSDSSNLYIYNEIINIINKCYFVEDDKLKKEIFINEFKKTKTFINHYEEEIELKDIFNIEEDEYAFLLGFNEGNYINNMMDNDYFSDKEKSILGIDSSIDKSIKIKDSLIDKISSIKNLFISYKLSDNFGEYFLSSLNEELNYEIVSIINNKYNYSNELNKLLLSRNIDNYIKYSEVNDELVILNSNYKVDYLSYDNNYKRIDKNKLYSYLGNKLTLSYSSLDNYYKCKYKYYLNNILKIDKYEETFNTIIGKLFHYILSKAFVENFDFEKEYSDYISNYKFNKKEAFFINKLKKDLLFIINTIKKQYTHSSFKEAKYEEEYIINKDSIIKVDFVGFIDKLLYKEYKNKKLLVIVDYKTGTQEINLNRSIYGLNLQLPIYLYLSKNGDISNTEVVGFYIQKLLSSEFSKDKNKSVEKQKEESLKLQGYSIYDEELLNEFDDTYQNSEVIKSLVKTKDGFRSYSKLLTKNEMNKLYSLVDEKINEARDGILNADFEINPKRIGFENISCKYCKYKDICFMNNNNIKLFKDIDNLDFLGGDNYA